MTLFFSCHLDNLISVNLNYVQSEIIDTGTGLDEVVVFNPTELNKQINDKSCLNSSSCVNSNYSSSTFLNTQADKRQDDVILDARYLEIINSTKHIDNDVANKIDSFKKEQVENDDSDESNWYNEFFSRTRVSFFELFASK